MGATSTSKKATKSSGRQRQTRGAKHQKSDNISGDQAKLLCRSPTSLRRSAIIQSTQSTRHQRTQTPCLLIPRATQCMARAIQEWLSRDFSQWVYNSRQASPRAPSRVSIEGRGPRATSVQSITSLLVLFEGKQRV